MGPALQLDSPTLKGALLQQYKLCSGGAEIKYFEKTQIRLLNEPFGSYNTVHRFSKYSLLMYVLLISYALTLAELSAFSFQIFNQIHYLKKPLIITRIEQF